MRIISHLLSKTTSEPSQQPTSAPSPQPTLSSCDPASFASDVPGDLLLCAAQELQDLLDNRVVRGKVLRRPARRASRFLLQANETLDEKVHFSIVKTTDSSEELGCFPEGEGGVLNDVFTTACSLITRALQVLTASLPGAV